MALDRKTIIIGSSVLAVVIIGVILISKASGKAKVPVKGAGKTGSGGGGSSTSTSGSGGETKAGDINIPLNLQKGATTNTTVTSPSPTANPVPATTPAVSTGSTVNPSNPKFVNSTPAGQPLTSITSTQPDQGIMIPSGNNVNGGFSNVYEIYNAYMGVGGANATQTNGLYPWIDANHTVWTDATSDANYRSAQQQLETNGYLDAFGNPV